MDIGGIAHRAASISGDGSVSSAAGEFTRKIQIVLLKH
jgi:hypothetical protein